LVLLLSERGRDLDVPRLAGMVLRTALSRVARP
jgi:hypothetical protein